MKVYIARRWQWAMLLAVVLFGSLLLVSPARAGTCGDLIPDLGACVDAAAYDWWKSWAMGVWALDRLFLIGAYQINQFRWMLVDTVFLSAYDAVVALTGPLLAPFATLALTLAVLALVAVPFLGRHARLVNLRQIVILMVLGTTVLTQLGPWVAQLERMRTDLVGATFGDVSTQIPQRIFGAQASDPDMLPVTTLYGASCHGQTLTRGGNGGRTLADAAAALLWADATDIHCPDQSGTSFPELPARWTNPAAADYAYNGDVGDISDAHIRADYRRKIQAGFWRAVYGLLPCMVALLEELVQCAFACSLIVLALAVPVMWLYSYFQDSFAGLMRLTRGAGQIFKVSLTSSFLLSVLVSALIAATSVNDAMAYTAFSIFGGIGLALIGKVAGRTLIESIETASASVETATGYNPTEPARMVAAGIGTVASAGMAVATGGANLAIAGMVAGFGRVGGLASAMGASPAPAAPEAPPPAVERVPPAVSELPEWAALVQQSPGVSMDTVRLPENGLAVPNGQSIHEVPTVAHPVLPRPQPALPDLPEQPLPDLPRTP